MTSVKSSPRPNASRASEGRVTKTRIDDEELRLRTELKTAAALAEIGNHYKEFGLADKAKSKYKEAIAVGEETAKSARKLKGRILEESSSVFGKFTLPWKTTEPPPP